MDFISDSLIAEAISRQGGYEKVELDSLWGAVASALGKQKTHGAMIKARYEDMLRHSVQQEEEDDDDADHEVEQILDKRTHQGQLEQKRMVRRRSCRKLDAATHACGLAWP